MKSNAIKCLILFALSSIFAFPAPAQIDRSSPFDFPGSSRRQPRSIAPGRKMLPVALTPEDQFKNDLDLLLDDPAFRRGVWGIQIQSLDRGDILYSHCAEKSLIPASNMKLFTTAAALALLGPDFRYETRLVTGDSDLTDGVVNGDLYVLGSGDPTFSRAFHEEGPLAPLTSLARVLRTIGIRRIEGHLIGDDTIFDDEHVQESWWYGDLTLSFAAEPGGLSLNSNSYRITAGPGEKEGDPPIVHTVPPNVYGEWIITATTSAPGSRALLRCHRAVDTNRIVLEGSIPLGSNPVEMEVTIHNPTLFFTTLLKHVLEKEGIEVSGRPLDMDDLPQPPVIPTQALASCQSAPIAEIVAAANKPSENFFTNQLLKTLGARFGKAGSFREGTRVVTRFLQDYGIDTDGFVMVDGSGMSRVNLAAPEHILALLRVMANHPQSQFYRDSLPIAGRDGTLRNRMRGTPAENKVHAKTGHVRFVSCLSGYVTAANGEKLAFSTMANNLAAGTAGADALQDRICAKLAEFKRP